jgi:phospho-N-acetylmuramoyl-pentapeptide-transferase
MFLIAAGLFTILPLIYSVVTSFKPLDELLAFPPRFFVVRPTWKNYAALPDLLSNLEVPFIRYVFNQLFVTFAVVGLQLIVSVLYLYLLYKEGSLSCNLYIPFVNVNLAVHPMVYIFFAMFVMVGCVNAVNLTDGVDGLSSSVTIPVMIFFTAAAIGLKKYDLALLPASLVGGLIAYLFYNWHPAKVFMGDTGSLFLGGAVCALAFALDMPLILILVGFVYICETMSVILQVGYFKLTHGKRLFKMAPIHHHFEMCGWKEEKVVLVFAGVSAVMCVLAWIGISGLI